VRAIGPMTDPSDASAWPSYPIGPRESVFALGVVSVNYASLEFVLGAVFANVTGLTMNAATSLLPNISNHIRLQVMRDALSVIAWPTTVKGGITHFTNGFEILAENRNLLMHSNLVAGVNDRIALYKSNRRGETILTVIDPEELRRVADDMMAYRGYGSILANLIASPSTLRPAILPPKPPLPRKLNYSSQPQRSNR